MAVAKDVFIFLEIFSGEGGIQSYVKDILKAYKAIASEPTKNAIAARRKGEVFLLRDGLGCDNPLDVPHLPQSQQVLTFHYLKTLPPWLGRVRLSAKLLALLLTQRPHRVFCGHIYLAPLVQTLCQWLGIPYTILTYGKEVWEPLPPRYQKALQQADSIWTISRYSRDRAAQANHLDPQKFRMIPCAVNGDSFTPGPKPPDLLAKYGLGDAKVLMTVARLWSGDIYKGVDVTIRALPSILQKFANVKYLVIGRGDDQPRLAQLAKDLGVAEQVIFAGFVSSEELPAHYRVADAYIMPSQEGFGIVYLEAMACGVPVVSGDADGSADPLQDGKMGWRVPHRSPEAVAAACIEILRGSDRRCHREWLRAETLAVFSTASFTARVKQEMNL